LQKIEAHFSQLLTNFSVKLIKLVSDQNKKS